MIRHFAVTTAATLGLISGAAGQSAASSHGLRLERPPILPTAISSFGAACHGGYAYVFGGHTGRAHQHSRSNLTGAFRRLNLADGHSWEELPSGPPLQGTALVANAAGVLYRVGGLDARNAVGEDGDLHSVAGVDRFDPATGRWTAATPLPEPRSSHDAFVVDGRLYVVGGWALAGEDEPHWMTTAWAADVSESPTELKWERLPDPPFQRRALTVTAWQGRVAVVGGLDDLGPLEDVALFDPKTGAWSDLDLLPGIGFGAGAIEVDGALFASVMEGRLCRLARPDAKWETVGQFAFPRFFHRFVTLGDGRLLALAGAGRGGHFRICEWLDLPPASAATERKTVTAATTKRAPVDPAAKAPESDRSTANSSTGDTTATTDAAARPKDPRVDTARSARSSDPMRMTEFAVPFPGATRQRHAVAVRNNELWILGGNRGGRRDRFAREKFVDTIWKLNLPRLDWTRVGKLPAGRQSMAAIWHGERHRDLLLLGGLGPRTAEAADSKTVSHATGWSVSRDGSVEPFRAAMPTPRTQFHVVQHGEKLFAIGGIDFRPEGRGGEASYPAAVAVCDPAADAPEFRASEIAWEHPRRSFACAQVGSKVYLIGGLGDGFRSATGPDVLDLATGEWSHMPEPPSAWVSAQAVSLGGKIYVAGGGTMRGQRFTADRALWCFDPDAGTWEEVLSELPFATRHCRMLAVRDRLWFVTIDDHAGVRLVVRTLKPDPNLVVAESSFHR